MIQLINLNNNVEREMALEAQGYRRTRRWVGDHQQAEQNGWYQAKRNDRIFSRNDASDFEQAAGIKPCQESQETIFNRIGNLLGSRYQPVSKILQGNAADC